jgi:predicted metal-binding membrane protein
MESSAPELSVRILRHERLVIAASIVTLAALAWWFILAGGGMAEDGAMAGMSTPPFAAVLLMWSLMMAAMMLPSATPAVLLYARVRQMRNGASAIAPSWVFLTGYLALWLLFSLIAAVAQRLLTGPTMALDNRGAEAALLILAGVYQLSPLKSACLRQCRAPAQFISHHWRPGWIGAFRLGLLHGAYCVGCCWALMLLLFVGGVMNLIWVIALAIVIAAEKILPRGDWIARATGIGLAAWGLGRLLT